MHYDNKNHSEDAVVKYLEYPVGDTNLHHLLIRDPCGMQTNDTFIEIDAYKLRNISVKKGEHVKVKVLSELKFLGYALRTEIEIEKDGKKDIVYAINYKKISKAS